MVMENVLKCFKRFHNAFHGLLHCSSQFSISGPLERNSININIFPLKQLIHKLLLGSCAVWLLELNTSTIIMFRILARVRVRLGSGLHFSVTMF